MGCLIRAVRAVLALTAMAGLVLAMAGAGLAQSGAPGGIPNGVDVPPALAPWQGFALYRADARLCPPDGNRAEARICLFPTSLGLAVDAAGADFTLRARLFDAGPVSLPRGEGVWTESVRIGGRPVPVIARPDGPAVWLGPGEYELSGRLGWNAAPESLGLPPDVGLVRLSRQGADVPVVVTPAGELRLSAEASAKPVENHENVKVFRRIADGVPVTVTTLFRLEVSGLARTVTLAGAVPSGATPLAVRAPVPSAFGPDGGLVLDAGPGRYEVEVVSRYPGPVAAVGPAACPYGREVWSFAPAPAGREVRPEGPPAIDPRTAEVPAAWQELPAFAVTAGETLTLRELGRGVPAGRDALVLSRELWLDFSGQGLSARDTVSGENRTAWTLSLLPPGELGRTTVAGRDQPVVLTGPDGARGVALRDVHLSLAARSRYPDAGAAIPAGGFDREFDRITASLHLPPGWNLLAASGPDEVAGGLVSDWTLLDLFLVFLLAMAAFSLRGAWAGVALGGFLLFSWHEPGAPTTAWVFVLAGLGLVRLAGEAGRLAGSPAFRRFAVLFFALSLVSLVVVSLPFVAGQLRRAVAPQIAPGPVPLQAELAGGNEAMPVPAPAMAPRPQASMAKDRAGGRTFAAASPEAAADAAEAARLEFDPSALVQTGPAMPSWHFATVSLAWKGPVAPSQTLRLVLVPPLATMGIGFARVCLLGLAAFLLFDRNRMRRLAAPAAPPTMGATAAGLLLALGLALGLAGPAAAGDFPDKELLDTLRARLTEPARCFPDCLGSPGLSVALDGGRLTVTSEVDAAVRTALPLPRVSENWRPDTVTLDGRPAAELTRAGGSMKVLAEAGRHVVVMSGPAPAAVSFTVTPALAPGRTRVTAPGYRVRGLDARGVLRGALELTRAENQAGGGGPVLGQASAGIPPFFEVSRQIRFGLSFEVATEVVRRSPPEVAAVAVVPLLPGEWPDAAGVTVRDGQAVIGFAPGQSRVSWRSRLPAGTGLTLTAPDGGSVAETWTVTAAPFYDVAYDGLPPVAILSPGGGYAPRFAPWPGESLALRVTRPEAAPGEYLTLERAVLTTRQGGQTRDSELAMTFRAAKGTRHAVRLPREATVTRLDVAGRETLPTGTDGEVGFALPPGLTEVSLRFREPIGTAALLRTPAPDLGLAAATAQTRLEMPGGRWLLAVMAPTLLGPAVLYWGWLAAVVVLGLGLSALPHSPLSRRQWFLYALGLSQATPAGVVLAVAWLPALGTRRRHAVPGAAAFNAVQVLLVLLTLAGLAALYDILGLGLLGLPRMQVAGGGSTAASLVWTWDRVAGPLPEALVVSAPMAVFRGLMLAWAVWLAWSLLGWLRFAFDALTEGGGWRKVRLSIHRPGRGAGGGKPASGGGEEEKS
ncbi:hypothetical protein DFW101_3459 [Solidesulfovibrio carbinoliphilus subsp. oakridgensis]|uniref:Uncharacterized protein n=2 Tax=Solidesulfovibrio carbinoliphilus TaxID=345370 RepID=G7QBW4_9BACT|nr:hypothetical protein DFW101_3459 [Solidesulfovibrio carbinoliphilus subsp. oakridgensis]